MSFFLIFYRMLLAWPTCPESVQKGNSEIRIFYVDLPWQRLRGLCFSLKSYSCCRYGLFENNEMTQREIADQLHISRSYVSRIEKNALKKLKTLFSWFSVRNTLKLETDCDVFSRKEVFYSYDRYNWTIRLCIYAQTIETTADSSALYCFDRFIKRNFTWTFFSCT